MSAWCISSCDAAKVTVGATAGRGWNYALIFETHSVNFCVTWPACCGLLRHRILEASMTGFLTTHVLDTASGIPAAGMQIDLYKITADARVHLVGMVTNDDGRTDRPILPAEAFEVGQYELVFQAGAYFGRDEDISFLDEIPLRFGINDASSHYHVPLLVSPFSFSTYRGS
jgi:5-hydroxyisourate hydrolase